MQPPVAALLDNGTRLHLQHGPIDLIIGADSDWPDGRQVAFEIATDRFSTVLNGLVADLTAHRSRLRADTLDPADPVARRMYRAGLPFCTEFFVTPMIAVAGAVADEILAAMIAGAPLSRAYVNNGGDIALHLTNAAAFSVAMASARADDLGRITLSAQDGVGGVATSGAQGRSLSLGIADSVTVLAASAAEADAAATLIANAVDLPGHNGITRTRADALQPDSDLGQRLVVTAVPDLSAFESQSALARGRRLAHTMTRQGHIIAAALFLQGHSATVGQDFGLPQTSSDLLYA